MSQPANAAPPGLLTQTLLVARLDLLRRLRDRSILLQVFLAPIVLALIVGGAFGGTSGYRATILIADADQSPTSVRIAEAIEAQSTQDGVIFEARAVADQDAAEDLVAAQTVDASVVIPQGFGALVSAGSAAQVLVVGNAADPIAQSVALSLADGIAAATQSQRASTATATATANALGLTLDREQLQAALQQPSAIELADARLSNPFSMMSFFAPGMAMIFLFFVMGAAARSIITERREGTLDRMLAGPTPPTAVLLGKATSVVGLGLIGMLTVYLITTVAFGVDWGDPLGVLLIIVSVVLAIAGFSLVVTGLAKSEQQAEALTIIGTLVFAVLGGTFVFTFSGFFAAIRPFTPNGQALIAFIDLSAGQASVAAILPHALALLAMALVTGGVGLLGIQRGLVR